MKRLILLLFLLFCSSFISVNAATWVQIDENYYIDKNSIKIFINDNGTYDFSKKVFWIKNIGNKEFKNIEALKDKNISYSLVQYVIDFSKEEIATKSIVLYDKDGNIIDRLTLTDTRLFWDSIAPDSNASEWSRLIQKPREINKLYKLQQENNQ